MIIYSPCKNTVMNDRKNTIKLTLKGFDEEQITLNYVNIISLYKAF